MTITPTPPLTLEPWKRTLRTVISVALACATAALLIVALPQLQTVDPTSKVGIILTWVTVVSGAITRFAASDAGNYVFGLIGLDAAHVINVKKATTQVVADVTPVVAPVVAAVTTPGVDPALAAADAVTVAVPAVHADVVAAVAAVQGEPYVAPVEVAPVAVPVVAAAAPVTPEPTVAPVGVAPVAPVEPTPATTPSAADVQALAATLTAPVGQ